MCRYGETRYKRHFACLSCHKAFKRPNKSDVNPDGEDRPARCPQCALLMADMGRDFAPPKTSNERAWRTLAALYEVGETFHGCGCGGPGYRPRDPAALSAFFADLRRDYRQNLEQWIHAAAESKDQAARREEAIRTWSARVARIEAVK